MRPTILAMMLASGSVPLRGMAEGGRPGLGEPVVVGERGPGGLSISICLHGGGKSSDKPSPLKLCFRSERKEGARRARAEELREVAVAVDHGQAPRVAETAAVPVLPQRRQVRQRPLAQP